MSLKSLIRDIALKQTAIKIGINFKNLPTDQLQSMDLKKQIESAFDDYTRDTLAKIGISPGDLIAIAENSRVAELSSRGIKCQITKE